MENMENKNKADAARERYRSDPEARRKQAERNARWKASLSEEEFKRGTRSRHLSYKFKMTIEDYERLLAEQGGHCALCPAEHGEHHRLRLHVDHDHACCPGVKSCGKCVRGLLCGACNALMGMLELILKDSEITARPGTWTSGALVYRDGHGAG